MHRFVALIPRLPLSCREPGVYDAALAAIRAQGFTGELTVDFADRAVLATDNSIYQVTPEAVAYPRDTEDLVRIARVTSDPKFREVVIRPRGGGTGTNGQSLGDGLTVDVSRNMNRVLEINPSEGWARVQPGVVKDQLNEALARYGLFFAPELSTSNRATIGGMISTDASGQGSCLYGKTRDHVLSLTIVLYDGTKWTTEPLEELELSAIRARADSVGRVHRVIDDLQQKYASDIEKRFPKLNRCLTGYDLKHLRDSENRFNLASVICGSEGTLCFIAEAKVRALPLPQTSAIVVVRYDSFDDALGDAQNLMTLGAASVETIDETVLTLAKNDGIWQKVFHLFPETGVSSLGTNFIEFVGDDVAVRAALARVVHVLQKSRHSGVTIARGDDTQYVWEMRKRAVGLLGNMPGTRRPVPFVEDTVVPPDRLRDYIREFRAVLDRYGLDYGMFGHVDAGVLHVRPALDMRDPAQERLVRPITDEVVALTQKYGGLLWGEHGKGFRSEFTGQFFGPLTQCLNEIKAAFDPRDQFNPGKIASAKRAALTLLDEVPLRGHRDRQIKISARDSLSTAINCNGNGACFNFDVNETMCPSWKATRDRRHSPKGRSVLIREWLRQLTLQGYDFDNQAQRRRWRNWLWKFRQRVHDIVKAKADPPDFSHAVKEAMDGCLACKACTGACPIKIDVPTFRAKFLALYHTRYRRPLKDFLVVGLEHVVPYAAHVPTIFNAIAQSTIGKSVVAAAGLVDIPALSLQSASKVLKANGVSYANLEVLSQLSDNDRKRSVILVQDAFTSYFEAPLVSDLAKFLQSLGVKVWLAQFRPNGKPAHVYGMLRRFKRVAQKNALFLQSLASTGIPLVGLDPSMTLTYRLEYAEATGQQCPKVLLLQEWLDTYLGEEPTGPVTKRVRLLPHCTERSIAHETLLAWKKIFRYFGIELDVVAAGCCGMAGAYGHDKDNQAISRKIFELSWARQLTGAGDTSHTVATGYSCRCQTKRFASANLKHPVQFLLSYTTT